MITGGAQSEKKPHLNRQLIRRHDHRRSVAADMRRMRPLRLSLHVAERLSDTAISKPYDIDSSNVPCAPIVSPAHNSASASHEFLLDIELCAGVLCEKACVELTQCRDSFVPFAVRRWTGVLEHCVLSHLGNTAIDIVSL